MDIQPLPAWPCPDLRSCTNDPQGSTLQQGSALGRVGLCASPTLPAALIPTTPPSGPWQNHHWYRSPWVGASNDPEGPRNP